MEDDWSDQEFYASVNIVATDEEIAHLCEERPTQAENTNQESCQTHKPSEERPAKADTMDHESGKTDNSSEERSGQAGNMERASVLTDYPREERPTQTVHMNKESDLTDNRSEERHAQADDMNKEPRITGNPSEPESTDSDDVPLSFLKTKLKQRKQKPKRRLLLSDLESDDSFEDKDYKPSSESMSSEDNNGDSYKSKKKWFRTRIRPLKREENRKYQNIKKINKDIKTKEKQKSKRSDTHLQNENKKHGTLVGSERGYEAQLQKAVQLSRAQHNVNTILKKHGEARLSNLLTSNLLMKVNVKPDGNCYYNALLPQLNTSDSVQDIRRKLCKHLMENKEHYQCYIPRPENMNDEEFSKLYQDKKLEIQQDGIWNVELADLLPLATANYFNRNITIYSSKLNNSVVHIKPDINSVTEQSTEDDIRLAYLAVRQYEHYDACVLSDKSSHSRESKAANIEKQEGKTPLTPKKRKKKSKTPITPKKTADYISPEKTKSCRKRTPNVFMWKKNVRKRNKATGKSYVSAYTKKVIPAKQMGLGCSCKYRCTEKFSEDARLAIFNGYYEESMTYQRQRDFICQYIIVKPTSRRYSGTYKHNSRRFYLPLNGERVRVCKKFFMSTLCVGDKLIRYTLQRKQHGVFVGTDNRGKHAPANKTSDTHKEFIRKHIECFPVVESHYTRKSTKRGYLSQDLSIRKMHDLYKIKCQEEQITPASEMVYRKVFCTEYNLSFHKPKKDICQVCNKYNEKTKTNTVVTQEDKDNYQSHIQRKENARIEKEQDKQLAKSNKSIYIATFDLEAVLSTPCSTVSQVYYKRKLNCYNLTFFSLADKHGTCYIWDETHGQRGSSEIGTCVITHINSLPSTIEHVILYSDSCSGQNRNQYLSGGLLYTVNRHPYVKVIEQKFLETGHTQMECDAMHSSIEHAKKCTSIFIPDQWDTVIHMARRNKPYTVVPMRYESFYDLKCHTKNNYKNFKTDSDNNQVNWLKVKVLRVSKDFPEEIHIKYDFSEKFKRINVYRSLRGRPSVLSQDLPRKYTEKIQVSEAKKKDLLDLCDSLVIPAVYHGFYQAITTSKTVKDKLPVPDVDDIDSDSEADMDKFHSENNVFSAVEHL